MASLAAVASGIVLLGAGVAVGTLLIANRPSNSGNNAATRGSTSTVVAGNTQAAGPPPDGLGSPPLSTRPPSDPSGKPIAVLTQPLGDSQTIFVVQGRGWPPGVPITVALAGVRASPIHVIVDAAGSFNYAINQDHEFFRFGVPPGSYRVVVTAPGGERATASFVVNVPPGGPPPQG